VLTCADLLCSSPDTEGLSTPPRGADPAAELVREIADFTALDDLESATPVRALQRRDAVDGLAAECHGGRASRRCISPTGTAGGVNAAAAGDEVAPLPPHGTRYSSFKLLASSTPIASQAGDDRDCAPARSLREGGNEPAFPVCVVDVAAPSRRATRLKVARDAMSSGKGNLDLLRRDLRDVKA